MDFHQRYEFNPKRDLLGKGGFSKVYKATDTLLDRTVALKFFTGTISDKYQVLTEIKKVIRFEHPNLCKYYDVAVLSATNVIGETEQVEVGIMEYIDAGDIKTYTRNNPQYVDKLLIDVLKGLAFLHRQGIVHRDLKPQNILIKTEEDEPVSKITDFGISKVIAAEDHNSSTLLGTIEYMAPEQFNPKKYGTNGRITTNLDLWSFGLLVYEAVCQESFFGSRSGGVSAEQVMTNILSDDSWEKAETMPPKYREIVKRCLVKNAADRVQNALELIPLFEHKGIVTSYERNSPVAKPDNTSLEVTKVIEPEIFLQEEIEDSDTTQEMSSENTQVIDFAPDTLPETAPVIHDVPEDSSETTQVIHYVPEDSLETTQVISYVPEETEAETQVIELAQDSPAEITEIIEPIPEISQEKAEPNKIKEIKKVEGYAGDKQFKDNNDVVDPRPLKKIFLLSFLAALLIILFIAYPFLNRQNRSPEQNRVEKAALPPTLPLVEDWKPELISVKGGLFTMGDFTASDISSAIYAHEVALSDYALGKYEVTVAQFKKFIDETGYRTTAQEKGGSDIVVNGKWTNIKGIDWQYDVRGNLIHSNIQNIPVVHVSWADANAYCQWLSKKTGETYRLLTEAEWEFAAKGGKSSKQYTFSGSDSINEVAWYGKNSDSSIHAIGTKKPNELGIYDMSGNAMEWCYDWYNREYYRNSPTDNPKGPNTSGSDSVKVLRGGAWAYEEKVSRIVQRTKFKLDVNGGSTGFRVCRENK